eukprot:gene12145-8362_t
MTSLLVAGSTGAVGRGVVQQAITHQSIHRVLALSRQCPTKERPVEALFDLPYTTTASPSTGTEKVQVETMDWDDFHRFWMAFSATSVEEQEMLELYDVPAQPATPMETSQVKKGGGEDPVFTVPQTARPSDHLGIQPSVIVSEMATDPSTGPLAHQGSFCALLPPHLRDLKKDYDRYKAVFSGHSYAALCMGTTKKDAGGMQNFIRCDYTYMIALVEALLCFSGGAGWDVTGDRLDHVCRMMPTSSCSDDDDGDSHTAEHTRRGQSIPTWISYPFSDPELPFPGLSLVEHHQVASRAFQEYYSAPRQQQEVLPFLRSRSSKTLRGFSLVSSTGANHASWFGYLRVKGAIEEALVERVRFHNQLLKLNPRPTQEQKPTNSLPTSQLPLRLAILRPGIMNRGDKARFMEKLLLFLTLRTAIKAESCASCIMSECCKSIAANAETAPSSCGRAYGSTPSAIQSDPLMVFQNAEILQEQEEFLSNSLTA